jgi:PAS domain S-box-containing protein
MRQIRAIIIIGFTLAFAILGVVGVISYRNTTGLLQDAAQLERTNALLASLTRVLGELNEAESNQRGYLISGDSSYYLPRYLGAVVGTRAQIGELRGLVAGDSARAAQVERLQTLLDARIAEMETRIAIRREQGLDAVIRDLEQKRSSRDLLEAARLFDERERRSLAMRADEARANSAEAQITIVLGTIVAVLLMGLALIIINREIRNRMAAHHALLEKEEQLVQIMDGLPMGVLVIDRAGIVKYVNRAARNLFGERAETGVDFRAIYSVANAVTGEPIPDERMPLMRALRGESTTMSDQEVHVRDRLLEVGITAAPVYDAQQHVVFGIAAFTDISARRTVERMKDEFLSMVSHELRTPLTSIRGALGLLATGKLGQLSDKGIRMVEIATSDTDRLVRLINDILDIERMESGRVDLERAQVAADQLVQRAVEAIQPLADRASVKLTMETRPVTIWADADRIVQTITNLTANAIKFSPAGARVHVTLESAGDDALFSVQDQGRGIPGDKLQTIFERFQQVDASDARQKGGAGLGLAISRSIVVQHGGHIWAESDGQSGSTFRFTIPVRPSEVGRREDQPAAPVVLVGEESVSARAVLQSILHESGYDVMAATTGYQVLEQAEQHRPVAILLDVLTAEMDGWETARRLHQNPTTRDIPVVILSALSSPGSVRAEVKIADWLQKPLEPRSLIESVERAISTNGQLHRVLIVADDVPLANVLRELFESRKLESVVASNAVDAVRALEKMTPDAIVLDLMAADATGIDLANVIRSQAHLRGVPIVIYAGSDLSPTVRKKSKAAARETSQPYQPRPEDVARRVALLLHRVTDEN